MTPVTFRTEVRYGDQLVTVESSDFREFHKACAAIAELDRLATWMHTDAGVESIVPEYHKSGGDEYFGFADAAEPRRVLTFGEHRTARGAVPFYPKPDGKGYYDGTGGPAPGPRQSPPERRQAPARPQAAPSTAAQTDGQAGGRPASGRTVSSDQVDQVKRALKRYDWDPKVVLLMLVEGYGVRQLGEVPEERGAELLADATSTKAKSRWASVLQERQRLKAADGRAA